MNAILRERALFENPLFFIHLILKPESASVNIASNERNIMNSEVKAITAFV